MIHLLFRFRDQQFFLAAVSPTEVGGVISEWYALRTAGKHGVITRSVNGVPWAVGTEHLMFVHVITQEELQQMAAQASQAAKPPAYNHGPTPIGPGWVSGRN